MPTPRRQAHVARGVLSRIVRQLLHENRHPPDEQKQVRWAVTEQAGLKFANASYGDCQMSLALTLNLVRLHINGLSRPDPRVTQPCKQVWKLAGRWCGRGAAAAQPKGFGEGLQIIVIDVLQFWIACHVPPPG